MGNVKYYYYYSFFECYENNNNYGFLLVGPNYEYQIESIKFFFYILRVKLEIIKN